MFENTYVVFLAGNITANSRHTLLMHCDHVTMYGVIFRIPSWASLCDLVELVPFGGVCPLADKLL